jgi:CubicO group peptidase (beta-lactamase class C family)
MTYKTMKNCLRYMLFVAFLLILQVCKAQYDFSKVDGWLKENLNELGGRAVLLIYKDGKIIYNKAENGLSQKQKFMGKMVARKTGKDVAEVLKDYDSNSKIGIASCSKWLSAALVMTFVDEGKLRVTDSIGKWLPVMSANSKGHITIQDCLSHMTGIKSAGLKENRELTTNVNTMDEVMNEIAKMQMEATPGSAFHYSSIGLQIAAAVIEKISGKDFETLFAERIAAPCKMLNTDFGHKKVPLPAGGALSTATDYLNFLQMILNDGTYDGTVVLQKQSILLMQQNYVSGKKLIYTPAEAGNWGYGFGEWVMDNSMAGKRSGAVTSPGLFGSFPWVDNEHNYAAVLFTFNLKSKGRNEKYTSLKRLVDDEILASK